MATRMQQIQKRRPSFPKHIPGSFLQSKQNGIFFDAIFSQNLPSVALIFPLGWSVFDEPGAVDQVEEELEVLWQVEAFVGY